MKDALAQRCTTYKQYHVAHGAVEVLIETLLPPIHLVIFGAGYDAVPLVKMAKELSWRVSIIDYRASHLMRERFAAADKLILAKASDLTTLTLEREYTAAVLLSHNFEYDLAALAKLLPLQLPYLGVLGPKRRTEKLLAELQKRQFDYSHLLENLYAPIGLDIGAELPEEIALAILAEIKAVMTRRKGSFLRERKAPIHETR
ncbi:MAG: XdhC family protein [Candidatus Thermochlorobacter sp.]